ncbi:MAG: hypothetical protein JW891_08025 [Candidatus Lokiarchaeota archaeon]|nr:hypothetical protein [Candidatus Lokiarchaeota archaeon]
MRIHNQNQLVFFAAYFLAQMIYIYINAFLPIYFNEIFSISGLDLGLVLYTSYSFMLAKPLFSIYLNKEGKETHFSTQKKVLIIAGVGTVITFALFIFNLSFLIVFSVFLGLNFLFIAFMDVIIDKIIIQRSNTDNIRKKNAFFMQLGGMIGAIVSNIYFFIVRPTNLTSWNTLFVVGTLSLVCIVPVFFILKDTGITQNITPESITREQVKPNHGIIAKMCFFLFLVYGINIYEWVLEPWAIEKLASISTEPKGLFPTIMIIFIILDAISLVFAGKYAKRFDKKKLLLFTVLLSGALTTIAPLTGIILFFVLISIIQLTSGFFLIALLAMMMELSEGKVLLFQVMASATILSKIVLAPLGLFLFNSISGEFIVLLAGVLELFSLLPLYAIKL